VPLGGSAHTPHREQPPCREPEHVGASTQAPAIPRDAPEKCKSAALGSLRRTGAAGRDSAIAAITGWDLSDAHAWMRAPAGWLRADMSPKPVYQRLLARIRGTWWTARAEGVTDADGRVQLRGYCGGCALARVYHPDLANRPRM